MPDFFEFTQTSRYLQEYLAADDLAAVTVWQDARRDYQFSFHTQHEAGWPCYLVELNGPSRNLPKINVREPTNPPALLQGASVRTAANGVDFRAVITANMELFQQLAEGYYEGRQTEDEPTPRLWGVRFACRNSKNAKPFAIELPRPAQGDFAPGWWSNFGNRPGMKDKLAETVVCSQHKKNDCLEATVESFPRERFNELPRYFTDAGDVVSYV